jgi:DMSO reductase family type II enzyme heme b subunit
MRRTKWWLSGLVWTALLSAAIGMAAPAAARPGDVKNGKAIYAKRCQLCHGVEGDGDSPAAERLNPPPRDFTEGQYKYKTTHFDDAVPNDDDLFRMIRDGMPGTAMPGWSDVLSEQDMWDLTAYLKAFAGLEEEKPTKQVDYGTRVASSPDSIETGRKLFLDRCAECHGDLGKGDAVKKLKDDGGARTWPRNLTKPWTFRTSNDAKDVFTRISVGIPLTQMPSFADPKSKKKLSIEQRWHVANFVSSLGETAKAVRPENTVVKATKLVDAVPTAPDDPRWQEASPSTFYLVPQIIAKQRFFTPSNDTITVRAFFDDKRIALLLEWDDRTKSIPGDKEAEAIVDEGMAEDAVAVQLPVAIPGGMEKPYFVMGDAKLPVNIWHWKSGTTTKPTNIQLVNGRGIKALAERDAADIGLKATGVYHKGTWRVVLTRPLIVGDTENDIGFVPGRFIPIAFTAWDGSNGESGSKRTMTTWYWLLLEPPAGSLPVVSAILVILLIAVGELWWARTAARKPKVQA